MVEKYLQSVKQCPAQYQTRNTAHVVADIINAADDEIMLGELLRGLMPDRPAQNAARRLIDAYGSLDNAIAAPYADIEDAINTRAATLFAALPSILRRLGQRKAGQKLDNTDVAIDYCRTLYFGDSDDETMYVISLDAQLRLISATEVSSGTVSECSVYPRKIVGATLAANARCAILCHNHPGGSLTPSPDDIATTKRLKNLLHGVGVSLVEHIIIAGGHGVSIMAHSDV